VKPSCITGIYQTARSPRLVRVS